MLAAAATANCEQFNEQNLANIAWAYSTAGHAAPELYNALTATVAQRIGELKPQELANLGWAFAVAGHRSPALYDALAETAAVRGVSDFKPQAVANTVWSYAFAGYTAPDLFEQLATAARGQAGDFTPRSISLTVWAYASSGQRANALFHQLAKQATIGAKSGEFTPAELANTAWAYATAEHPAPELFDALAAAAVDIADDFGPQQVSMMTWAYAKARHNAPSLFRSLSHVSVYLAASDECAFTPQTVAEVAWAFSTIGRRSPILFTALAEAAVARKGSLAGRRRFSSSDLAKLAWAYAAADLPAPKLFNSDFAESCESVETWYESELAQLHEWQLWYWERGMKAPLSQGLTAKCRAAFTEASTKVKPSAGQRQIVAALNLLDDVEDLEERVQSQTGHLVDIQCKWKGAAVGVLVPAPDAFASGGEMASTATRVNGKDDVEAAMAILSSPPSTPSPSSSSIEFEPHELLGPMALRARQLSNLGEMPIVAIDYAEWKRVLPNNRFSKESDLTPEMALEQLSKRLAIKLDEATGAVADGGPPPAPIVTPGGKGRERGSPHEARPWRRRGRVRMRTPCLWRCRWRCRWRWSRRRCLGSSSVESTLARGFRWRRSRRGGGSISEGMCSDMNMLESRFVVSARFPHASPVNNPPQVTKPSPVPLHTNGQVWRAHTHTLLASTAAR